MGRSARNDGDLPTKMTCDTFALRHRTTVTHPNQPCGAAPGASRPVRFIPNRMTRTAASNASSAVLHGENESRSEPCGECARCQADDRGHGRRLGLSAPRAFPSSAFSGRAVGDGAGLKNALSGGNLGLSEASIWRISAYTDRCKDRR